MVSSNGYLGRQKGSMDNGSCASLVKQPFQTAGRYRDSCLCHRRSRRRNVAWEWVWSATQ